MKHFLLLALVLVSINSQSQKNLNGIVLDAEKNKPLQNVSVFLNTTSIGTTSNEQGIFSLSIPNGKYELIISSVGYETYIQSVNSKELPGLLTIRLKVKSEILQEVIVEPYVENGWDKWGNFFLENFIGVSTNAMDCKIKNTDVIHFRDSKKSNELTAVAEEPLVIENKALGYTILYQLESFKYDFDHGYLLYTGYPFFKPMNGNASKQKKWENRRKEVYYGSMMHFMRSVYRNTIMQEGFEVRSLKKVPATGVKIDSVSEDYYLDQIAHQDNYRDVIGSPLTGDSIAYAVNNTTAGLYFTDFLFIIYRNKPAPTEYRQKFPKNSTSMMSQILLINQRPVEIEANGNYYNPTDLISTGYWAWSEKIAMMLPFDYKPFKQ
jgi:hypothetical protein